MPDDKPIDRDYYWARVPWKTYVSGQFPAKGSNDQLRYFRKVMECEEGLEFFKHKNELILSTTPGGRYQYRATVFESDRRVSKLLIQRFTKSGNPLEEEHVTLNGPELRTLLEFVATTKIADLSDPEGQHIPDRQMLALIEDAAEMRRWLLGQDQSFLRAVMASDAVQRDIQAVGYRRRELKKFHLLLTDPDAFEAERVALKASGKEDVWQKFFELNTWIFGYGLSYQFLTKLDHSKLQQTVKGSDVTGPGKTPDGIMKSRGILGSLCFVEIKHHETELLVQNPTRPGVWGPSRHLSHAVSQVHVTTHEAVQNLLPVFRPKTKTGAPSGEELMNFEPRSFLVIGSLSEFVEGEEVNDSRFRSFELFRRNMHRPEILTFDELYERARYIVEHAPNGEDEPPEEPPEDEIPF